MEITGTQVLETLKAVVAERPDYVYEAPAHQVHMDPEGLINSTCFYVHADEDGSNERPGCLVGEVLHRLGVPLAELAEHEGNGASQVARVFGVDDRDALTVLDEAQCHQDQGVAWGRALEAALAPTGAAL